MNKLPSAASLTGSLSVLYCLSLSLTLLQAQNAAPSLAPYGQNQGMNQQGYTPVLLSPESLDQLVAPIALYPDALTALMLAAATTPLDVVLAERYLSAGGDPSQADTQPWDESVKGLLHYPDVVSWMDQNLDWTTSLGEAFATQPADVMNAIQTMRTQAIAAGNLIDTPQQTVIEEDHYIRILPADPQIIYVPVYDPEVVYLQPASSDYGSLITFGAGCTVGAWLSYDFDWGHRCFYHGNWNGGHRNAWNNDGNNAVVNVSTISNNGATAWQPNATTLRQISERQHNNGGNARIATAVPVQPGSTQTAVHHPGVVPHPTRVHLSGGTAPARQTGAGASVPTTATTQHFQQQPPTYPTHQVSQFQQQVTPTKPTSTMPVNQNIQNVPPPIPHSNPPQLQHLQQQPQTQQQAIPRTAPPELQQQPAEAIHQQAAPVHHEAPPAESHPRQNAPQVIQEPKAAPPQQHAAPAPAAPAQESKEHKKGEDKDKKIL